MPSKKKVVESVKELCCQCIKCGVQTCKEEHGSLHAHNAATDVHDRLCEKCGVKVWESPIQFIFAHGIPKHIRNHMQSARVLKRLNQWFHNCAPAVVYFQHRKKSETLEWQHAWEGYGKPRKPYSFRGWCGNSRILVLVDSDGIETPESIEWITYHELGHLEQQRTSRMSDAAWSEENKNEGRTTYEWEADAGHEADSEERHVNRVATAFMGGKEYARPWWRARVNAFLVGAPLPDPNK